MNNSATIQSVCSQVLADNTGKDWYEKKMDQVKNADRPAGFYLAFSSAPRKVSKAPLQLNDQQIAALTSINPAFNPATWTVDELCRVALMSALPVRKNQEILDKLFGAADLREAIALYKGLIFLDNASSFVLRAIDGLRTNIQHVFDAIALDNAFPTKYFDEAPWNQMVLKALFMNRPIYRIHQIDERKNATLALILHNYAQERWSGHRKVNPELWRSIVGYVDDKIYSDIKKVIDEGDKIEIAAAKRLVLESNLGEELGVGDILDVLPTWDEIGIQLSS
ncbi:MAG: EboA domain-containing protein [Bacteroidota bacterium]